jgi:hypothetical protein
VETAEPECMKLYTTRIYKEDKDRRFPERAEKANILRHNKVSKIS